jgi:hypothetical protein
MKMKQTGINTLAWITLSAILFFSSCENKTVDYGYDRYYVEIATAQTENRFLLDNGKTIVTTSQEKSKPYSVGERVLLNYTLLSETIDGNERTVRINSSVKIPQSKPVWADENAIHAAIKAPVASESIWMGSHYLNMQFYLNYKSETHKIGLLVDSNHLNSDTVRMYFTHDPNNDPPGYPAHTYLSFDLEDLLGAPMKAQTILFHIHTRDEGNKIYEFKY